MLDGKWAYDNLQAQVDYGFRATARRGVSRQGHYTALFRQDSPQVLLSRVLMWGTPRVGGSAAIPLDFDGIIVGAPR